MARVGHSIERQILPELKTRASQLVTAGQRAMEDFRLSGQNSVPFSCFMYPNMLEWLAPLEAWTSKYFDVPCKIVPHRSSFRVQAPDGYGSLAPHQDFVALEMTGVPALLLKRGLTFWLPLHAIDETTPTLAVGKLAWRRLPHITDPAGYAILKDRYKGELEPIYGLAIGDAVRLHPRCVHASYIGEHATATRYSLDIRVMEV